MSNEIFSEEEVKNLNDFQNSGNVHPFTCPNGHGNLIATKEGWYCPKCDYVQLWAHDFMKSGDWREMCRIPKGREFGEGDSKMTKVDEIQWVIITKEEFEKRPKSEFQKAIEEAAKSTTVIVIAHRLSTIENANHIIDLNELKK